MKTTIIKHLTSWRTHILLAALFYILSLIYASFNLLLIGFIVTLAAIAYQYIAHSILDGYLKVKYAFYYLLLSVLWLFAGLFQGPKGIHRSYAKHYEKKKKIENIVGIKLPRYKVITSEITHHRSFDFEFTVEATLQFRKPVDDAFFEQLDSIIMLPVPEEFEYDSSYFYYGLEGRYPCWTKEDDKYRYVRHTDFGKEVLHSTDAFFYFTITRGSDEASLTYGNY